jgi:septal ring factor EnvC (AmiA/AmiB activator)
MPSKQAFISVLLAAVSGGFALFLSITQMVTTDDDIGFKIQNLNNIQSALTTLNSYVSNQQDILEKISIEKATLESQSSKIKSALKIDKEKLDSLLEYQLAEQKNNMWLEIIISFLIGVLSSSLVTYIASKYQSKDKE